MKFPFGIKKYSGYCLKLLKALYGFRFAPLAFRKLLLGMLIMEYKLTKCVHQPCVFHKSDEMYIGLIADDLEIATTY